MQHKDFGPILREIRGDSGLPLRRLADEAGLDAAYLSRLERAQMPIPKRDIIDRIADVLCRHQQLETEACERLRRRLLEAAGRLTDEASMIDDLTHRFADRLRELDVPEASVQDAVQRLSLATMRDVLTGEEPLEVARLDAFSDEDIAERKAAGEEVMLLDARPNMSMMSGSASDYVAEHETDFSARPRTGARETREEQKRFDVGSRASFRVRGDLNEQQEDQLRTIAKLIRTILEEK